MSNYIKKFVIDDRRRRLASILARDSNMTHSDRDGQAAWRRSSTISADIKLLKQMAPRFIYNLAKGDLRYYSNNR